MKNERLVLLLLAAGMFAHIVDFMIIMPLGPQFERLLNITNQQFSLLVASYSVTAGISGFFSAFLVDRYDRKKSLLFVLIGFSLGTIGCAFAPNYSILLFTRSLTGAFGGVLGASILSITSDAVPLERRAKGIGTVMASFGVASIVGVPFGLFIADKFSWHAPFLVLGMLSLLISVLTAVYLPSITGHIREVHASPMQVLKTIFGRPNARIGLIFVSILMLGHFTVVPFVAKYMVGNVGFTELQLTYIYLVGGACTMFFSPWVGKMADRHGRLKVFTIFGILVIIPILIITNLTPVPLWVALFISAIYFVFSNGRMVPSTTMETAAIKPENRGSYMSIRSAVQQLTAGLASFIGGIIISEKPSIFGGEAKALVNYNYVGIIAVVFSILSLYIARKLTVEQGA